VKSADLEADAPKLDPDKEWLLDDPSYNRVHPIPQETPVDRSFSWTSFLVLVFVAACDTGPAPNESCKADPEACAGDTLCARDTNGVLRCLIVCEEQEDCPVDTTCNGVGAASKVCQTPGFE
jgi:hypothetical protein